MKNRLKKYEDFILESNIELILEANMVFEPRFKEILGDIDNEISRKIQKLENEEVDVNTNYIDIDLDKEEFVLFKPEDKVNKIKKFIAPEPWYAYSNIAHSLGIENIGTHVHQQEVELVREITDEENLNYRDMVIVKFIGQDGKEYQNVFRKADLKKSMSLVRNAEVRVGKFVRALLTKAGVDFKDTEIEDFVNKYKTFVQKSKNAFDRFKEVKGDDIKHWYSVYNYESEKGSLGSSCMRYDSCQPYLNIYTENPKQVSLIILQSKRDEDKISGRAILWKDNEGRKFMDRVYTINSGDEQFFKEYAISNGYLYRESQGHHNNTIMLNNEDLGTVNIYVELDYCEFDKYPYMDTLRYLELSSSTLTNNYRENYDYELTSTDGGNGTECESCGGSETIQCYECEGDGTIVCSECFSGKISCSSCNSGKIDCVDCDGSGEIDDETCETCDGDGEVNCDECDGDGEVNCDECGGDGEVRCSNCDGDGEYRCDDCY